MLKRRRVFIILWMQLSLCWPLIVPRLLLFLFQFALSLGLFLHLFRCSSGAMSFSIRIGMFTHVLPLATCAEEFPGTHA